MDVELYFIYDHDLTVTQPDRTYLRKLQIYWSFTIWDLPSAQDCTFFHERMPKCSVCTENSEISLETILIKLTTWMQSMQWRQGGIGTPRIFVPLFWLHFHLLMSFLTWAVMKADTVFKCSLLRISPISGMEIATAVL